MMDLDYIALYTGTVGGAYYRIHLSYLELIDKGYEDFIERCEDKVLRLTCLSGAEVVVAASAIVDFITSTAESRAKDRQVDEALKAEAGAFE